MGETKQTPMKRWNSTHDCKDYIKGYIELHRKYKLEVRVCSVCPQALEVAIRGLRANAFRTFWYDTPSDRTGRLRLERELILRWQSPFNKENWSKYGKPFGKI